MSKFILYLIEASVSLSLLYLLYLLFLRNETFFNLNRFLLLGILGVSLLYPFVSFDFFSSGESVIHQSIDELGEIRVSYYEALEAWSSEGYQNTSPGETVFPIPNNHVSGWILITILIVYGIGLVAMFFRLLWTYSWIYKLKKACTKVIIDDVLVVKVPYPMAPFSFLNAVFVHDDMLESEEFPQILAHEKIHVQQRHSFDLIFVQLLAAALWFNPMVWLLIKSLKTTHEYIADKKMINQGYSLVEYQSLLLRQLISNNSHGLVHNFNLSFIKKRITMMKIKESGWAGRVKAALVLSLVAVFSLVMIQCNTTVLEEQIDSNAASSPTVNAQQVAYTLPVLPYIGFRYDVDPNNSIEVVIYNGKVQINGQVYAITDIAEVMKSSGMNKSGVIVMKVDQEASMKLVHDVQWEFRKANRRKLLYLGQTPSGQQTEMAFLLPPVPGSPDGVQLPTIDDAYAKANDLDILKIKLGDNAGAANQQIVYDFVMAHVKEGKANYVVSAKSDDADSYNDYLVNLTYVQQGFNQIYQERAQEMFGINFIDLDLKDPADKEQYNAVRRNIPRSISVAERD